jgi:hypothetical protein
MCMHADACCPVLHKPSAAGAGRVTHIPAAGVHTRTQSTRVHEFVILATGIHKTRTPGVHKEQAATGAPSTCQQQRMLRVGQHVCTGRHHRGSATHAQHEQRNERQHHLLQEQSKLLCRMCCASSRVVAPHRVTTAHQTYNSKHWQANGGCQPEANYNMSNDTLRHTPLPPGVRAAIV